MDDTYDDGLVHSHNWAEPLAPAGGIKPQGAEIAPIPASADEQIFDDGLVHSHDWARN
jgi:hypothetical protein